MNLASGLLAAALLFGAGVGIGWKTGVQSVRTAWDAERVRLNEATREAERLAERSAQMLRDWQEQRAAATQQIHARGEHVIESNRTWADMRLPDSVRDYATDLAFQSAAQSFGEVPTVPGWSDKDKR